VVLPLVPVIASYLAAAVLFKAPGKKALYRHRQARPAETAFADHCFLQRQALGSRTRRSTALEQAGRKTRRKRDSGPRHLPP